MTRFSRLVILCMLAAPLASRAIAAQQTDSVFPRHNAWGAEAIPTSSGGAILRFVSSRSAWVAGLDFATSHVGPQASTLFSTGGSSSSYLRAQLGHRWYVRPSDEHSGHLRPTLGLGLAGTMNRTDLGNDFQHQWTAGGYVEGGATWFFSPHLSLGAVSQIQATTGRQRRSAQSLGLNGQVTRTTQDTNVWSINANLARVLAAVYF